MPRKKSLKPGKLYSFRSNRLNSELTSLDCKLILEEGNRIYELLIEVLKYIDPESQDGQDLKNNIQFFFTDHHEFDEATNKW